MPGVDKSEGGRWPASLWLSTAGRSGGPLRTGAFCARGVAPVTFAHVPLLC